MLTSLLLSAALSFSSPVHYDVTLAGNFGEPRPNHFHGGIDVKTGGVERKAIHAVADGYVSRVTTGLLGFGNAVYVTHPNGVTTVYCHLRSFSRPIQRLVDNYRNGHHCSFVTDARFSPTDYPVSEGQFIALSGNTGASKAPHLHLEFRNTRTGAMLDPLDFLGEYVTDNTPPQAHAFMAFPQKEGVFCGGTSRQTYGFNSSTPRQRFTAWGKVGFGIWANDYSETTYNHLGVYRTQLLCDGKEVFSSVVDNVPVYSNRQINIWGCYEHYLRSHVWYLKSFVEPGCNLDFLKTDSNLGLIDFNEERTYKLEYILSDHKGNKSTYTFYVEGRKTTLPKTRPLTSRLTIRSNMLSQYTQRDMHLVVPSRMIGNDIQLRPVTSKSENNTLSAKYSFYPTSCPLAGAAELSIKVKRKVKHPEKLYISSNRTQYIKGNYKDGWLTGYIRELSDAYEICYDDKAPKITPTATPDSWKNSGMIRLSLNDEKSGMKSYEAFVDGVFVYFEPIEKSRIVQCKLKGSSIKKTGKSHALTFHLTDNCGNTVTYQARFIW